MKISGGVSLAQINQSSFLRFLIAGGSATILHYIIMWSLMYFSSIAASTASAFGYIVSTMFNYYANSRYTFGGEHSHRRSLPRFLLVATVGLAINQGVLFIGLYYFLPIFVAQIAATAFVLFWNYFVNAVWTFARKGKKS